MSYRVVDDPVPSKLSPWAVNPAWPLFSVMMAGPWLAWPWFAFNAFAIGSPTRVKQLKVALGGFGLMTLLTSVVWILFDLIPEGALPYVAIGLAGVKITFTYWLHTLQEKGFELFEYFGGKVRNGWPLILVGAIVVRPLLGAVLPPYFRVILLVVGVDS
jgi:hypothetical protein